LINREGTNFGPELSEIGNKLSKNGLYMAIIHPDAGISFGYEGQILKLQDGSIKLGFIISETESELELRMSGGVTSKIDKAEILSQTQIETSLMPKNLHHTMTEQELVDLVEYLSSLKKAQAMGNN
jgi:putative heme-binding domain-containing protein